MPYAHRRGKRSMKRKRKGKKRRGGGFAKKVRAVINRQNQNVRKVKLVDRVFGIETSQNQTLLWADATFGSVADMERLMDTATKSSDQAQVQGAVKAGTYISPNGTPYERPTGLEIHDATIDGNERYLCDMKMGMSAIIKNSEIHACDVTVYEVVCNQSRTQSSLGPNPINALMDDLIQGFHENDVSNSAGSYGGTASTTVIGDDMYQASGGYVQSWDQSVHPRMSPVFRRNWKIVKSKSFRLQSGDEIRWKCKTRRYTFSPTVVYNVDPEENMALIKGITTVLLVKANGLLGRSNVAGSEGVVGLLKAELLESFKVYATLMPKTSVIKGIAYSSINKDNLTGVTLQDVTELEHKDEDPA